MLASSLTMLAPLAIVLAGHQLFRHVVPSKLGIAFVTWAMVAYYLQWRISVSMPWDATGAEFAWPLICLLVEAASLIDAAILYLALVRGVDRSSEADRGEARLRAVPATELPAVDVFVATYNESREVLEKTILGCLALDWPSARVWVLDDGRRQWLHDYALSVGAGYITRPDNKGAKAGNINHALTVTEAPYVAVFDADFVPRRDFLMRTMGFFDDPKIGIVQVPHSFYNHDPMQANLSLRTAMPDDQRFFFEAIMPGRDGWDAAFCCGSNSVTRRTLFDAIGGGLPEGSITEDMLLTLAALRRGFITRYLNEPLAHGLAPESITAFFVQRQRWAQGGMQILHLPQGPLGPGLRFIHRLLFLPTSWVTQSLLSLFAFITPIIFLLFGLAPMVGADVESVMRHALPMMVALVGGIACLAPGRYYPVAAHVLGSFQSFRILPVALQTLVRPKGLMFKVTPKGSAAGGAGWDTGIWVAAMALLVATAMGLGLNAQADYRIIEQSALLPIVAIWSAINIVTLLLVGMMCFQKPALRTEERFALRTEVTVLDDNGDWFASAEGDASLSGIGLKPRPDMPAFTVGQSVRVAIGGVGAVPGRVVRATGRLAIAFEFENADQRNRLIVHLFTGPIHQNGVRPGGWAVARAMIERLWSADLRDSGVRLAEVAEDPTKLTPASRALPGRWATADVPAVGDMADAGNRAA